MIDIQGMSYTLWILASYNAQHVVSFTGSPHNGYCDSASAALKLKQAVNLKHVKFAA